MSDHNKAIKGAHYYTGEMRRSLFGAYTHIHTHTTGETYYQSSPQLYYCQYSNFYVIFLPPSSHYSMSIVVFCCCLYIICHLPTLAPHKLIKHGRTRLRKTTNTPTYQNNFSALYLWVFKSLSLFLIRTVKF